MPTSWLDLLRWTLSSLLLCPESTAPVCGSMPTACQLLCPVSTAPVRGSTSTACQLLSPTNSRLASRYLFRPPRDFKSKNPLSGFAPKQTKESSAWRATHIVLQLLPSTLSSLVEIPLSHPPISHIHPFISYSYIYIDIYISVCVFGLLGFMAYQPL